MLRLFCISILVLGISNINAAQQPDGRDKTYISLQARRLVSDAEHTAFVKDVLATATGEVMISTYDISPVKLFDEGLGQAIVDAAERGVRVYVYYEHRPWYEPEEFKALQEVASCCAKFDENANHSKCVIKDKTMVAIGSCNWLSAPRAKSSNGTLVLTGGLALSLINDVWQGIRFYQSLEYGNERGVEKFLQDRDAFSTGEYRFAEGQYLYTLRTPEAHGIMLAEVLQKATKRVLVFSPFIRLNKLKETFSTGALVALQQRGVNVKLITLPKPCDRVPAEQGDIFVYLQGLSTRYPNFTFLTCPDFHAKTLVADDFICEGSFNWLSAVAQIDHDANNFEMSVGIRGEIAQSLIQSFENTPIGKVVLPIAAASSSNPKPLPKEVKEKQKEAKVTQSLKQPRVQEEDEAGVASSKKAKKAIQAIPPNFDNEIRIFSGEKYGKQGYCVRFNRGDYLRDGRNNILYFPTTAAAKQAAFEVWNK